MANMYEACCGLFVDYPLAVHVEDHGGGRIVKWMVLLLQDSDSPRFFVLSHDSGRGKPLCSIYDWSVGEEVTNIVADGNSALSPMMVRVVAQGFPIPHDGALLGSNDRGTITALTLSFIKNKMVPSLMLMPLTGLTEEKWPLYAGEALGRWFWDSYRAGKLVYLGELIKGNRDTVFFVEAKSILGSGCCIVTRDVNSPGWPKLPRGRYVYHRALRAGRPVPSLKELLNNYSRTDLASWYGV